MKTNVGSIDRVLRGSSGLAAILAAFLTPVHPVARVGLGAAGVYLLLTALAGACLGYRLMGLSTCRTERR